MAYDNSSFSLPRCFAIAAALFTLSACQQKNPVHLEPGFPARLSAGALSVTVDGAGGQLRVTETSQNRTLLRLSLKTPFLTVRRADDQVREKMASYTMGESGQEHCDLFSLLRGSATNTAVVITGRLSCGKSTTDVDITFLAGGDTYSLMIKPHDARFNRLQLRFSAEENENVFGGGEQFTHLNLRGRVLPMLSEEQGIGRGAQPITLGANLTAGAGGSDVSTYAPVPFFFTSAYRSFSTDDSHYQIWDFSSENFGVEIWSNTLSLNLSTASSFSRLVSQYTARTGRMLPLPDWAAGTVLGVQGGRDRVEGILKAALDAGNPVSAIWIQDWVGRRETSFGSQLWWRWLPDETAYPKFREWVADLAGRNIRVLGYVNPFLADSGPLFEEARQKGYFVRNKKFEPYKIQTAGFPAYLIDLSNADARNFIKRVIRTQMLDAGLAGYMADFGEWLPWDALLASGEGGAAWHNRYPVEWAKLNREVIREAGLEGKAVFFTRAGYHGTAAWSTLMWAGDQMVTFDEYDGLASAITGILTGGISGMTLNHSDIGGYTTINNPLKNYHRSRELMLRWAEFAVFTPFFRTHEGNRPLKNYQVYSDANIVREFAALGRLHLRLKPYFAELMREAADTGMPLLRPLFMHYPQDHNTFELRHQFMLGRDLIVAPVIEAGAAAGKVYLPAGTWIEAPSGRRIEMAGWHSFLTQPGQAVAFIRGESLRAAELLAVMREK